MRVIYFLLASFLISLKVNAQVTLNFDDLSEDFISEKKVEHSQKIQLTPISHEETGKKHEKSKVVVKKGNVKKENVQPSQKQQSQKKNYIVKEQEKEDAHDKLKPRSEPVPVVKVQEIAKQVEEILSTKKLNSSENVVQKENQEKTILELKTSEKHDDVSETKFSVKKDDNSVILEKKEHLVFKEKEQRVNSFYPDKKSSILSVNENNLQKRSDALKKFIPTDSKTFFDIQKEKYLYLVFVFEKKSSHLTEDMESWIDKISLELQKNKKLNLIIYSYSGPTDPEYGREHHLSLQRALRVRSGFSRRGITIHRISYRSWGKIGAGNEYPDRVDILIHAK